MARHEISYFITYWYQHEPSSTIVRIGPLEVLGCYNYE